VAPPLRSLPGNHTELRTNQREGSLCQNPVAILARLQLCVIDPSGITCHYLVSKGMWKPYGKFRGVQEACLSTETNCFCPLGDRLCQLQDDATTLPGSTLKAEKHVQGLLFHAVASFYSWGTGRWCEGHTILRGRNVRGACWGKMQPKYRCFPDQAHGSATYSFLHGKIGGWWWW